MITAYMGYYYYYFDPTYILVIIGALISLAASGYVKVTYNRYSNERSMSGLTGAEVAQRILSAEGLYDVKVRHISGDLTDNYNPKTRILSLSDTTYNSTSVAALGVAAHECGHAIQHAKGYVPIQLRKAILPFANWGARLSWILIFVGLFFHGGMSQTLLNAGIFAFSLAVMFQLITLPVEFNASSRAMAILGNRGILNSEELKITKKVLNAAALTYVAAAAASLLQLLRLVILFGDRRDRR